MVAARQRGSRSDDDITASTLIVVVTGQRKSVAFMISWVGKSIVARDQVVPGSKVRMPIIVVGMQAASSPARKLDFIAFLMVGSSMGMKTVMALSPVVACADRWWDGGVKGSEYEKSS